MFTPPGPVLRAELRAASSGGAVGMSPGHPCPRVPWLLASLLMVAGAAAAKPRQVNGVLGGSVLLSPALPPNKTVKEIEWSFSAGTGAVIQVAEFSRGHFERPDPRDRFKDRLEMLNTTALKIGALERGDSGVYGARIKLHPALVEDHFFNLSVYEPVPVPEIQRQRLSLTAHGCNMTLRCWVPAGSGAEATWQLMGTPWGQLCQDSQTLCLAVPVGTFNSSITCLARNPVQERSISIPMDTLCPQHGTRDWLWWLVCHLLLPAGFGALLGIVCLWRRKRRKGAAGSAPLAFPTGEDDPPEPLDAQIQRGMFLEAEEADGAEGQGPPSPRSTGQEQPPHGATD